MVSYGPLACPECGTPRSVPNGRCPTCGSDRAPVNAPAVTPMQPAAPQPGQLPSSAMPPGVGPVSRPTPTPPPGSGLVPTSVQPGPINPPRMRPSSPPQPQRSTHQIAVIGGTAGAVVIIGLLTYVAYPRSEQPPTETAAPAAPSASTESSEPETIEPIDYLGRAKTSALAWNREAQLVTITAGPVVAGRVVAGSNSIEFTFASPGGKLGPGARVGTERLVVRVVGSDKVQAKDGAEAGGAQATRSVADPGCTVEQAWRAAVASGVPSSAEATMTYEHNEKYGRAVWRTETADDPKHNRTLDGRRCTILTR
jgi:hypothetical protein